MIYCIGDSHISVLTQKSIILEAGIPYADEKFHIRNIGAVTAYSLIDKPDILNLLQSIPKDGYLILSFGEIDCRCRIHKASEPYKNNILVVKRYFEFVKKINHPRIILLCPPPCIVEEPMKEWFDADDSRKEIFTATRGTLIDRNSYKSYFGKSIIDFSMNDSTIGFLDFWGLVYDKREYYIDDIHLDGSKLSKHIKSFFND